MTRYAQRSKVDVSKSRNEIEKTLSRYGAGSFAYMTEGSKAAIAFEAHGRRIRMMVLLPDRKPFETNKLGHARPEYVIEAAWLQAGRQRWRALALVVKAKLEAVESGVATFEQEFLPYTLLPNGKTVAEAMLPQIEQAYKTKKMPLLLGEAQP